MSTFESGVKRKYKYLSAKERINHDCVYNLKPHATARVACSATRWALPYASGGGGPVLVKRVDEIGKMEPTEAPSMCVQGHKAAVHGCAFSPFDDDLLVTASDDGAIKAFALGDGPPSDVEGAHIGTHAGGARDVAFHPSAEHVLLSSGADGSCALWDVGAAKSILALPRESAAVHTLDWSYDGSSFLAARRDKTLRCYDARAGKEAWRAEPHGGARAFSAVWCAGVGGCGATVACVGGAKSGGREVVLLDPRATGAALHRRLVDTQTGELFPIWDEDHALLWVWGRGDATAKYYEVDAARATAAEALDAGADFRTASAPTGSVCLLPKAACDVMALEVGAFLRASAAGTVEKVTFSVPRTDDLKTYFNDDLFSRTRARLSSMDADAWIGGEDADPVLRSSRPASNPPLLSERVVEKKVLNTAVVNETRANEKAAKESDDATMDRLSALASQYEKFNVNRSMGAKPGVDAACIDGGEVDSDEWDD